jgi:hypothetical protein
LAFAAISAERPPHLVQIAMHFAWRCARADLHKDIVSTPLRNDAFTLSSSISSTEMRRSKRPY